MDRACPLDVRGSWSRSLDGIVSAAIRAALRGWPGRIRDGQIKNPHNKRKSAGAGQIRDPPVLTNPRHPPKIPHQHQVAASLIDLRVQDKPFIGGKRIDQTPPAGESSQVERGTRCLSPSQFTQPSGIQPNSLSPEFAPEPQLASHIRRYQSSAPTPRFPRHTSNPTEEQQNDQYY